MVLFFVTKDNTVTLAQLIVYTVTLFRVMNVVNKSKLLPNLRCLKTDNQNIIYCWKTCYF